MSGGKTRIPEARNNASFPDPDHEFDCDFMTTAALHAQQPPPAESTKGQTKDETKATSSGQNQSRRAGQGKGKSQNIDRRGAGCYPSPLRVDGKELVYTATAGLMPIKDAKGEVEARIFFMAYTLDDSGPSH